MSVGLMMFAMSTMLVFGVVCTYKYTSGGSPSCTDESNCNTYLTPVPYVCANVGTVTGLTFSGTQTNVVTQDTMSGGNCCEGSCIGGSVFSSGTVTNVDQFCNPTVAPNKSLSKCRWGVKGALIVNQMCQTIVLANPRLTRWSIWGKIDSCHGNTES